MTVLVTGGAGYIGSVTVDLLRTHGQSVVVLDDLSRGNRTALDSDVPFYQGNVGDQDLIRRIVEKHCCEACIHFAAYAYVQESVRNPGLYYENNVAQGIRLMESLRQSGIRQMVFSSSCAIYGEPREIPILEQHPQLPLSPYGWTKYFLEQVLADFDRAYDFKTVVLRYFNAAGATVTRREQHNPEPHLIPNVLAAAQGDISHVRILGDNYSTPDGTPIRDYVHVSDLAAAHFLAWKYLQKGGKSDCFNLGSGRGYSVLEIIEVARKVTKRRIELKVEPRRAGDPSHLVAKIDKANEVLGWEPTCSDMETILRTAWDQLLVNTASLRA